MSLSPEERLYIDNYLQGRMSGIELQRFMEKLEVDPAFRSKVSMQNLLVESLIQSADQELRESLLDAVGYKKPRVPLGLKLILTFVIIMFAGIVIWNIVGHDPKQRSKQLFNLSWLPVNHDKEKNVVEQHDFQNMNESNSESEMKNFSVGKEINMTYKENENKNAVVDSMNPDNAAEEFEQITIKQDQLLIAQTLRIFEDTVQHHYRNEPTNEPLLSQEVAAKLDPAAGIEIADDRNAADKSLLVEFWISPVNYKGYKFAGDKLIIFGIDEPGEVSLLRDDGVLFLKYFNELYMLRDVEVYSSLTPVKTKTGQSKPVK